MKDIATEITLEAPVVRVWELISDTGLYQHWNPLFKSGTGLIKVGGDIELVVKLPELDSFGVKATVLAVQPWSTFCWQYTMSFSGLFNWRYSVELEVPDPDRTKLIQRSRFGGLLGPLFQVGMGSAIKAGLTEMNKAVKRWGEKGNVTCLKC